MADIEKTSKRLAVVSTAVEKLSVCASLKDQKLSEMDKLDEKVFGFKAKQFEHIYVNMVGYSDVSFQVAELQAKITDLKSWGKKMGIKVRSSGAKREKL